LGAGRMNELNLSDLVNNLTNFDAPEQVKQLLQDIHLMSNSYKNIVRISICTYAPQENAFQLYIGIHNKMQSTNAAYISYDKIKGDFFDWLYASIKKDVRFTYEELMKKFEEKFEDVSR
jgi:hypothetical protein